VPVGSGWGCRAAATGCLLDFFGTPYRPVEASPPPPPPPLPVPGASSLYPPTASCLDIFGTLTSARHLDPPLWCSSFGEDREACLSHYVLVDETRTQHLCLWDDDEAEEGEGCYRSEPIQCV
jgi:hypothetical protein